MNENEKSLKEAMAELKELTEKLQDDNLGLEDSFALYTEGVKLVNYCSKKIEKVECDIKLLNEANQD